MDSPRPIQVTPEQLEAISRWAEDISWITEVWLFGSRARGTAKRDSDFDIAVTIRSGGKGNISPDALWFFEHEGWKASLSSALQNHISFLPKDALPEQPTREAVLIWSRRVCRAAEAPRILSSCASCHDGRMGVADLVMTAVTEFGDHL